MKKTNTTRRLFLNIACAGIFVVHANAAIVFTETSDFSDLFASPSTLPGSLGVGANIITGTLPADFFSADMDVFLVQNPSLLSIESISILISDFVGTTTDPARGTGFFQMLPLNDGTRNISGIGVYTLNAMTLNDISQIGFRVIGPSDGLNMESGSMNYQVTITAIPEPSSTLLIGTFALIAALKRRRNR